MQSDTVLPGSVIRAESLAEESMTVDAVLATSNPVTIRDPERDAAIDEVLVVRGIEHPEQIPLIDSHDRSSIRNIVGSVRNIRAEGENLVGTLHFVPGDELSEKAWNLVRAGHLTDVSISAKVIEDARIPAGVKRSVGGREFAAGPRPQRVVMRSRAREVSLTPIGADSAAKIVREVERALQMDEQETSVEETQRNEAAPVRGAEAASTTVDRSEQNVNRTERETQRADRDEVVRAERKRIREINDLVTPEVPEELVQRSIDEGWSVNRAGAEFHRHLVSVRREPVNASPEVRRQAESADFRDQVLLSVASRSGTDVIRSFAHQSERDRLERMTEDRRELGTYSLMELCREIIRTERRTMPTDRDEIIREAMSTPTLSYAFTSNVNARVLSKYDQADDSTRGWVLEVDENDFKTNDLIMLGRFSANGTIVLPRGKTAPHGQFSDSREQYKLHRYAAQFVIDEQDIIDDRLSVFQAVPDAMGDYFATIRPDLVYSILLANGTLADSGSLFNNTATTTAGGHANLTTAVLGADGLKAGLTAIQKQREGKVPLNLRGRHLVIPADLEWKALELMNSTTIVLAGTAGSVTERGSANVVSSSRLNIHVDDRIGAAGCTDPLTGTAYTGLATNWFLATDPGRTIQVGYLAGKGRRPYMRRRMLDAGQYGMGWDICLDIAAKAVDFRGLHKSTGAG
jgi:hypothetical protein